MKTPAKICFSALLLLGSLTFSLHAAETVDNSGKKSAVAGDINLELDVHAAKFLQLADEAWNEVLKEKIKEHIKAEAKGMDKFAKLIAEANYERWKSKTGDNALGKIDVLLESYIEQVRTSDADSPYKSKD